MARKTVCFLWPFCEFVFIKEKPIQVVWAERVIFGQLPNHDIRYATSP